MNDLGKHLQFPTRTFHKPSYLQDFLQRLGLIFTKEQKGKAVVVCVRAPAPLLATYRLGLSTVFLQHCLSLSRLFSPVWRDPHTSLKPTKLRHSTH